MREYREILAGLLFTPTSLAEQGVATEVPEEGDTFLANAVAKARAYADMTGLLALADDSGLEVDALRGAPGVRSARFAGEGASDAERNAYLLRLLEGVPPDRRTARFVCVIAIAEPEGELQTVRGTVEGMIAPAPRGGGGFGYDPLFYLPWLGRTMAELSPAEKNRLSHRARAGAAARSVLAGLAVEGML